MLAQSSQTGVGARSLPECKHVLTRCPLTHASHAYFSPSINIAAECDKCIRPLVGWVQCVGASAGLRRDDEEALVQAAIGTNRRCQDYVETECEEGR